jgi:hypothetical protein
MLRRMKQNYGEPSAHEKLRTPTPHLEMLPYGVLDGKFLSHRAAPIPPNCSKSMLELAKGFEPLTL